MNFGVQKTWCLWCFRESERPNVACRWYFLESKTSQARDFRGAELSAGYKHAVLGPNFDPQGYKHAHLPPPRAFGAHLHGALGLPEEKIYDRNGDILENISNLRKSAGFYRYANCHTMTNAAGARRIGLHGLRRC